jgi:type VI secretion system protein VasG
MGRDLEAGLNIDTDALAQLEQRLREARAELEQIETRWAIQRDLATRLLELRKQCASARAASTEENSEPAADLQQLEAELREV